MFHGESPLYSLAFDLWDNSSSACAVGEKLACGSRIADRGRKTYPSRVSTCHSAQSFDKADSLTAAVTSHKRVYLVYDDESQVTEKLGYKSVLAEEHSLKGFGSYLENTRRFFQHPALVGLCNVAVPVPDRDMRLLAKLVETHELVVYKSFQRTDINSSDRTRHILTEKCQDREEGSLSLSRGSRSSKQDVLVGIENSITCRSLNCAERLPVITVNEVLYKRSVSFKNTHIASPYISNSANSSSVWSS